MINQLPIIVYDLETDHYNPEIARLWEISALVIDPRTLEIKEGESFSSLSCPPDIKDWQQYEKDSSRARDVNKIPLEDIKNAPAEEQVFKNFVQFVKRYSGGHISRAPIFAGFNNINYDNVIIDRLCRKYKTVDKEGFPTLYNKRDKCDVLTWLFYWFENQPEPAKYNLSEIRRFFGLSEEGSHRSDKDVIDTALILCRMMKFQRKVMTKYYNQFKGSFCAKAEA